MMKADHRLRSWAVIAIVSGMTLCAAIFLAFWYVIWPFTPNFVMKHSPWILPLVRSFSEYRWNSIADDLDWEIGQARIAELAKTKTEELEVTLVDCLRGGDSDLRVAALQLVWHVAERRQIDHNLSAEILRAFNDPHNSEVRSAASHEILFLPRPQAEQMLTEMFDSGDEHLQAIAVYGMSEFSNRQLVERVLPWLSDPDLEVQRQALFLLSVAKDRASIPKVRPFVHHQDREIALRAKRFMAAMDAHVNE